MAADHARGQRGFTLIELGTTLLVLATFATVAVPGFDRFVQRRHIDGVASELVTDLQYVRSAAVARNRQLRISFSTLDQGGSCYVLHTGPSNACRCTADGGTACADDAEALKTVVPGAANRPLQLRSRVGSMLYDPMYGTTTPANTLHLTGADGQDVDVVVNMMGRVTTCSPAALTGYRACE